MHSPRNRQHSFHFDLQRTMPNRHCDHQLDAAMMRTDDLYDLSLEGVKSQDSRLFRHFSGLRGQVQTATVEQDGGSEVLLIAETTRRILDPLDLGIDGFAGSVRDAVAKVGNYVLKAPLQGSSHFEHGAQPTAYGPSPATNENVSARAAHIGSRKMP